MKISDLSKFEWEKGEEWFDKWYNTELEFVSFNRGPIPLVFSKHSLNSIALNTRYFYIKIDVWGDDIKNAVEKGSKFLKILVFETEKSTDNVKQIIKDVEHRKVDKLILKKIKRGLIILWNIFTHKDTSQVKTFIITFVRKKEITTVMYPSC